MIQQHIFTISYQSEASDLVIIWTCLVMNWLPTMDSSYEVKQ